MVLPLCMKHTLSLFCRRSFLFGSFPYRRKSLASSGDIFYVLCQISVGIAYGVARGAAMRASELRRGRE